MRSYSESIRRYAMTIVLCVLAVSLSSCGEDNEPVQNANSQNSQPKQSELSSKKKKKKRRKPSADVAKSNDVESKQTNSKQDQPDDETQQTTAKKKLTTTDDTALNKNASNPQSPADPSSRLEKQLAAFKVPPAWFADVKRAWNISKPWKEARIEIRRLLGKNDDKSRRDGIKLTWEYLQKKDIGDGHEYGMYMFLGNEPLWAIIAYREYVVREDLKYPPYFGLKALAVLYAKYGLFEEGEKLLQDGLDTPPPKAEWREMRKAEMHDALGDLYVAWNKLDKAKSSYQEAARLYPLGKPPYGRHLLPRRAKKVQSKIDLLSMKALQGSSLRNGMYREKALGYSGDINLTVQVSNGRVALINVQHKEKIDQDACRIIPKRIVDQQSLQVDGISGATVTKDAIVGGTLRALRQAGLK